MRVEEAAAVKEEQVEEAAAVKDEQADAATGKEAMAAEAAAAKTEGADDEAQDEQRWHREVRAKSIPRQERQEGGEHRWGTSGWWSDYGTAELAGTAAASSGAGAETVVEDDRDHQSRWGWPVAAASAADDADAWAASPADGADDLAAWNSSLGKSWSSTRSGWEAGRAEGQYEGREERRRLRAILHKQKVEDGEWEPSRHGGAAAVGQDLWVAERGNVTRSPCKPR